jgi:hypothetical protein
MRFHRSGSKMTWSVLLFPAVLLVTLITGCGSDSESPDAKKARQERSADIRDADAKDSGSVKARGGKKSAVLKSIKGGLGGGQPASD